MRTENTSLLKKLKHIQLHGTGIWKEQPTSIQSPVYNKKAKIRALSSQNISKNASTSKLSTRIGPSSAMDNSYSRLKGKCFKNFVDKQWVFKIDIFTFFMHKFLLYTKIKNIWFENSRRTLVYRFSAVILVYW